PINSRQTRGGQNDRSSILSSISGIIHGNTTLSSRQGRGIVDTITSHSHHLMVNISQDQHNLTLILGQHLSKAVSMQNQLVSILGGLTSSLTTVNVHTHTNQTSSLLGNVQV